MNDAMIVRVTGDTKTEDPIDNMEATTPQAAESPAATSLDELTHPDDNPVEVDHGLYKSADQMRHEVREKGTKSSLDSKMKEYMEYCHDVYPDDVHRCVLSQSKVYRFMFYQICREQ